jgi:putative nucleotidyltransferase with HDIG domain
LLLGFDMIFRIVCAISFAGPLGTSAPGYETEANGLWVHSLQTAAAAEYLAGSGCYGDFPTATAFTAGLLHDIGKTIVGKVLTPKNRADIRTQMTGESLSRVEAEKVVLGADHAEIGAALLKRWMVPEPLLEAAAHHHSPIIKPRIKLSALIYLANCGAHLSAAAADTATAPAGWQAQADQIKQTAAGTVGLPIEQVDQMMAGINDAMGAMSNLMAAA